MKVIFPTRKGPDCSGPLTARSQRGAPHHVVLLHLSEQCNHPDLAMEAAELALESAGRDAQVHIAPRRMPHPAFS